MTTRSFLGFYYKTGFIVTMILLLLTSIACSVAIKPQNDIPKGPYCGLPLGSLPDHCCISRNDECSVPMNGTKCYCDEFCLRQDNEDCCPDFWGVCVPDATTTTLTTTESENDETTYAPQPTAPAPAPGDFKRCFYEGKYYDFQANIKINCNNCKCKESETRPGAFDMACENVPCLIDTDLMTKVNTAHPHLHWRADNHSVFWGHTLQDGIQLRLGTLSPRIIVFYRTF
ncbi:hypothetical protein B566_EDAN005426 [Ephemera danica]|nr:hypothetical protein B566_EDAN005426 [Ephemera danica]